MPELAPPQLSPADSPAVTAHMTLLQGIINRLATSSASCKTWCLTLTSAFLSLAGVTHEPRVVTFALVPVVIFGFIDTMYLTWEKSYRDLYTQIATKVRDGRYKRADAFNAKASLNLPNFLWAFFSWSIIPVYGGLVFAYFVASCTGVLNVLTTAGKTP